MITTESVSNTCSLAILIRKVDEQRALDIVCSLCDKVLLGKKEQQREVASIGLKAVIAEIPGGPLAAKATTQIAQSMLQGTQNKVILVMSTHQASQGARCGR